MAFVPKINFCIEKTGDEYEIIVSDITDIYDAGDNPTGWEDASTIVAGDVTEATLTITYINSSNVETEQTINVLSQIDNPVVGQFDFDPISYSGDGYYKIVYTIVADGTTYTACKVKMPYVNVGCCISKKILKLVDSGCGCTKDTVFLQSVHELKAMEYAYNHAVKTVDSTSALCLLKLMEDLCNSNKDCNCK